MAYVTVYSPKGEKFEVASRDRADKLILEEGWTQNPPVEEKPKKTLRRKKKEAEEETFDNFAGFAPAESEDEEPKDDNS
jgi:hypothetical protein